MTDIRPLRRALVSVYDKTGLDELARDLHAAGVSIVSTGSTAKTIEAAGVPVTPVEELTGFPECLDGRVKTLHPRVHAGILADLRLESHVAQLAELDIEPFDLVVVNLYPFIDTVASGCDAGRVRRADRHRRPVDGPGRGQEPPERRRRRLARPVRPGARRDGRRRLHAGAAQEAGRPGVRAHGGVRRRRGLLVRVGLHGARRTARCSPSSSARRGTRSAVLRYGENPHQAAALYRNWRGGLATAEQLHGKEMSYNNYVDTDAARRAAHDFEAPAVAIIKHANPCGIAIGADIAEAHARAHACDPVSAYGGVIAANRPVSVAMAEQVAEVFTEVIVAPGLRARRPRGAAGQEEHPHPAAARRARTRSRSRCAPISGGILIQQVDRVDADRATTRRPGRWPRASRPTRRRSPTWRSRGRRCGRSSPTRSCWPRTAPRSASAWAR